MTPDQGGSVATGRCLCGAVQYSVARPLRDVILCHCTMCRRTHGHVSAYTAVAKSDLAVVEGRGLGWYRSSEGARRGFCRECGASLFWEPAAKDYIAITAGTLDPPTGLRIAMQIYCADAGDYYALDDSIPRRSAGSAGPQ